MNATQRILNALQKFQKKPETFFGFLGRKDGVVKTTRQFYSYVLLYNNQLIEAFNDKVPNTPGLPVEVQVVGGEYKIVGIRDVYNDPLWMGTPEHYFTHEWPGYDSVPIHGEQFIPGLVSSVSLFVIRIYGITYYANGGWTPAASIDIDLASYKPATGAIWLLVELGSNGIVNLIPGANFTLELLANNIPSPTPGARALAAVKLYAEQFQLQQTKYRSDIRDLRFVSSPWIDPSRFGIWYFHSESSGAYLILNQDIPEQVETSTEITIKDLDGDSLIQQFIIPSVGKTILPAGSWWLKLYYTTSVVSVTSIWAKIYEVTPGDSETLLFDTRHLLLPTTSGFITLEDSQNDIFLSDPDSRIAVKIYSSTTSPDDIDVAFVYEGITQYSRTSFPLFLGGSVGIEEAPITGTPYSRQDASWVSSGSAPAWNITGNGDLTITVHYPERYVAATGGDAAFWKAAGTSVLDLSGTVPGAGYGRYVLIWYKVLDGSIDATSGGTVTPYTALAAVNIPAPEDVSGKTVIGYVRVYNGQTVITDAADIFVIEDANVESGGGPVLRKAYDATDKTDYIIVNKDDTGIVAKTGTKKVADLIYKDGANTFSPADKTTLVDADKATIWDSVDSLMKLITWANVKAALKTYFDTLYLAFGIATDTNFTTGFVDRTKSTLTLSTRTLTIAPAITSFDIYSAATKIVKTGGASCATTIADTVGLHYVYFDATGTLQNSMTAWDIEGAGIPVCTIYWNGSAGAVGDERHSAKRNNAWHLWAHDTIGTRYESGLGQTYPDTTNDGLTQIETGHIHDEDIDITTGQQKVVRLWYETAAGVWTWANGTDNGGYDRPYIWNAGTSRVRYPKSNSAYALTDVGANDYVVQWVYASTDKDRSIYIVTRSATAPHNTIGNARAETTPIVIGILSPEMKLSYRWIYKGDGQYQEASDYRTSSSLPGGATATVPASQISFAPAGGIAAANVQAAIEELDTEKVPTTRTLTGTAPITIAGDNAAHDLSADRTIAVSAASTSAPGIAPQATAPAAGLYNYVGITNAETAYTNKPLFDATVPTTIAPSDVAAAGTAAVASRRDHLHAAPATFPPTAHAIFSASHSDIAANSAPVDGDIIIGNVTPKWSKLAITVPASAPLLNVLGVVNGETRPSWKVLFDATNPANIGAVAPGTSTIAAHRDHIHAIDAASASVPGSMSAADFQALRDGWIPAAGTWTYASASTITVPTNATTIYKRGMPIKFTQHGTVKYANIKTVAATLLTIIVNTDYVVEDTATYPITLPYYSTGSPFGFPAYFNFTTAITYGGGTTNPTSNTVNAAVYRIIDSDFFVTIKTTIVIGTGNRTSIIYSLPVTANAINDVWPIGVISNQHTAVPRCYFAGTSISADALMTGSGAIYLNGSALFT